MILRPLTDADAAELVRWRYPGRYSTYNFAGDEDLSSHYAAEEDDALVGYCCFGAEARVDGMRDEPGVLDVGWGLRPDLMGQGRGPAFIETILTLAGELYGPERFRVAVLDWNERSQRAALSAGFEASGAVQGGRFLLFERPG